MSEDKGIVVYTKAAFLNSTAPFEDVYQFIGDKFTLQRELEKMSDQAKAAGVRNFKALFKAYCDAQKRNSAPDYVENVTDFDGQPIDLNSGRWEADDLGIRTSNQFGFEVTACCHPIMPVRRLVNIDTGIEKLELAFRKGRGWRYVICDKKQLASASSIVALADYGIAVTSENAKYLVTYLHDIENLNYDIIPESRSVSRLGWIDGEGFSPYVDDLIFDGDASFKHFFESVKEHGSREKWIEVAKAVRKERGCARLMLAASFASVLIGPCGGLPFIVHLWGGTETGKTVGLMLAASVWANPDLGKYIHTFNSTSVAQELSAGFVNSLPLCLDELQIVKDKRDFDNTIYQLCEGVGRNRGQKTGGLQKTTTWENCILTTGEQPISGSSSGGGAVNRVIEINCEDIRLFEDPVNAAEVVKHNYGFAGREFVEKLQDPKVMEQAVLCQKKVYKEIVLGDTTEKQALSASLLMTADIMSGLLIFHSKDALNYEDVSKYLSTKNEVSESERAYSFLLDWIASNQSHFDEKAQEVFGKIDQANQLVYIIRSVFDMTLIDNGYNPTSFLHWLRRKDLIVASKGFTKTKRLGAMAPACVWLKVNNDEIPTGFEEVQEHMPF